MKRRNFISQISVSTAFLGLVPLNKLFAFTSLHRANSISNISTSQQIRHGALSVNEFATNSTYSWVQSVKLQTFLANGISKSNSDLLLLSIKLEGLQVHLSAINDQIIVNYDNRECKMLLRNSSSSEIELPDGYSLRIVDINDADMTLPRHGDVKVICLKGAAFINDKQLKQGKMMENIIDHNVHIHATKSCQLCIVDRKF